MTDAKRDENRVPTLIGVSELDLKTPTNIAVDPITGEVLVQQADKIPTDSTKLNAPMTLTYDGSNHLITIIKTIGIDTFTKTLTWDSDNLIDVSSWVKT